MKVERIDHIHIVVKDLKAAAKKFSDIMGTKWVGPIENDMGITAFDSLGLELLQPTSPDSSLARFIEKRGEGLYSIGFKVSNLDEAVAELEAKGIRIMWKGKANENLKVALTHPHDTYGVMLELLEFEDRTIISLANLNLEGTFNIPSPI